jgi:hypothetical protein
MYLTDFNMMLDSKLIDCFSEIALDKDVINKFNFNEIKQTEIKQTETEKTNDDDNEFYNTSKEIVSSNSIYERKITVRNTCNTSIRPSVKVTTRSTRSTIKK